MAAGACSSEAEREPGVEALNTDLTYGIEDEEAAPPPNTGVTGPQAPPPASPPASEPDPFEVRPLPGGGGGGESQALTCPTAPPTEQPDEDVNADEVEGQPAPGFYQWRVAGGEWLPDQSFRSAFSEFVRREIFGIKGSEGDFQFSVQEQELTGSDPSPETVTTTFQVSDSSIDLIRIQREESGGSTTVFSPTPAITYLQFPVLVGPENGFESRGVDVASAGQPQILEHTAHVVGRKTVDACGTRIRAWHVTSEQTFTIGAERVSKDFDYGISTHLGGLFTFEDVRTCEGRDTEGNCQPVEEHNGEEQYRIDYTAHIGQLEPEEGEE